MSRRKRFWHVAPQYYAGVLVGTLLGVFTTLVVQANIW